jgi:16S rRNA processing protein RimM
LKNETEESKSDRLIKLGHVAGVLGVQGWVKIHSYTDPRDNILNYASWNLVSPDQSSQAYVLEEGRTQGKTLVAKLKGIEDRDDAVLLLDQVITVQRGQLPEANPGEYYWSDLEGLTVVNTAGAVFGTVTKLIATGANDVLVVQGDEERLIPFVPEQVIKSVELDEGRIIVAWDSDY